MARTQSTPINGAVPPQRKTRGAKNVEQTLPPPTKSWYERMTDAVQEGLAEHNTPSWVRTAIAAFCGLAAGAASWVGATMLVDKLVVAAVMYTGAAGFLSAFIWALGMLIAFLISVGTGIATLRFVENFHLDGVSQRVGGWFRRSASA